MKNWINGAIATCSFELRRSFTIQRTAVSVVLALFPPTMITLMIIATAMAARESAEVGQVMANARSFSLFMIVFLVSIVTLLSLLLWATPNVYSELEGKSWSFVASRPGGRISILLGKFIASVAVSFSISLVSLTMSIAIAERMISLTDAEKTWLSLCGIFLLANLAYGAVFSMLGTLFYKRAMVVAAGYLIGSEFFLGTIPAVVSKLTMRFHLQSLGLSWLGFFLPFEGGPNQYAALYGDPWSDWIHVLILIGAAVVALVAAGFIITNRQYISSDES